jgi:predicted ArsR family transcriptional regulator
MSTKREILELLKQQGAMSSQALAQRLSLTAMAVKLQLYELEGEGIVESAVAPASGRGRPCKLWRLTEKSEPLFPNAHAALSRDILTGIRRTLGERALNQVLDARAEEQLARYQAALKPRAPLHEKLKRLAELRTEEGYMACIEKVEGTLALVENHCPICSAARECVKLCSSELDLFRKLLGPTYAIERTEHIIEGARRCAYKVTELRRR